MKLGFQLSFSPEAHKEGYYGLIVVFWNFLLERALDTDMLVFY